ncbi:hypothetical protein [Thiocystis violacea]|uniref:hypothetical protein n=1 Tax=Thiocystis violacea TaxID=13725 RepID=UPI0019042FB9|nr:hypothetical protein [Thiocystis violacea]MBK1717443.1 hypothetical protein [Thiocystis violacea]
MDSTNIDLNGSEIESITVAEGRLDIQFSRAYLVKTMTGSEERTRWWQAGSLMIDEVEMPSPLPEAPLVCAGGDLDENIYTYRDMIPVPFESRGHIRCELRFQGTDETLLAIGTSVRLTMRDTPKYIEHLRSGQAALSG